MAQVNHITAFLAFTTFVLIAALVVLLFMLATVTRQAEAFESIIATQEQTIADLTEQRDAAYSQLAEWASEDAPITPKTQSLTEKTESTNAEAVEDNITSEEASEELSYVSSYVSDDVDLPLVNGLRSLGTFKVTHYDCCVICCGNSNGITASGRQAVPDYTIAVDPSVIPLGSAVWLDYGDGVLHEYRADDTGGAVKGNTIDVCCADHATALLLGVRSATVYYVPEVRAK